MATVRRKYIVRFIQVCRNTNGRSFLTDANMCGATHFLFGILCNYFFFDHANTQSVTVHGQPCIPTCPLCTR